MEAPETSAFGEATERSPAGNFIKFNAVLGKGSFKQVYRGQDVNNGNLIAWNEVNTKSYGKRELKRIMFEITLLKTLAHPHLLAYYGGWANTAENKVVFVTELMSSGTLKDFSCKYPIPLKTIKRYCREILECLQYLHTEKDGKKSLIHRDLKCENIFINAQGKSIKIGDLGLATTDGLSIMGTPEFMAPGECVCVLLLLCVHVCFLVCVFHSPVPSTPPLTSPSPPYPPPTTT